ncbi:MAG: dipeptide epimerase [Planctomycetes bacterium]|nr:dipeptide epimerase [Planctomycetota bacterium]
MMKATCHDYELTLRHTFRIARSATDLAENVLVLVEHGGLTGVGEAHPNDYHGEDHHRVHSALELFCRWLPGHPAFADPLDSVSFENQKPKIENLLKSLPPEVAAIRGAVGALDMALHDLVGQMVGKPLWELFGADPAKAPVTSFTIGIAPVPVMQEKVREAERYPLLKIKVGTGRDLEILEGIRAVTDKPLRVDANAAWTVEEAIRNIRAIEPFGIEFIEQPIPPGDPGGLRRIREAVSTPIIVDESVATSADLPPLAGAADGINIKLMKCGGLQEARRMLGLARSLGLKVMLGCFVESSVAITAAAHLSPLVDYADLDGHLLIANDPYDGVALDPAGRLLLPDRPGLGLLPRA